jgi:hypothetical protein
MRRAVGYDRAAVGDVVNDPGSRHMRIIVTDGAGSIGSNLVDAAARPQELVTNRLSAGEKASR